MEQLEKRVEAQSTLLGLGFRFGVVGFVLVSGGVLIKNLVTFCMSRYIYIYIHTYVYIYI